MSSVSSRATWLAVLLATLAVLLSTALPISAAGRFSRLKPGVLLQRWRCARNRGDRQSGQVRRRSGAGQRHPQHPAPGCARASWRLAVQPCSRTGPPFHGEPPAMVPLVAPDPMAVSACLPPVTGSRGTRDRDGGNDESQELSGGGESRVS